MFKNIGDLQKFAKGRFKDSNGNFGSFKMRDGAAPAPAQAPAAEPAPATGRGRMMDRIGMAARMKMQNGGQFSNFKMADGGSVSKDKSKAEKAMEKAGGMLGQAGKAIMTRKDRVAEAEAEATATKAKYADGGMVKKKAGSAGHSKIAAAHRDKPFTPK